MLSQNEVFELVPAPCGVLNVDFMPSGMLKVVLPQTKFVLPYIGAFKCAAMSNKIKFIADALSNMEDGCLNFLTSILIHSVRKLVWSIQILLKSLQHVSKIYISNADLYIPCIAMAHSTKCFHGKAISL